MTERAAPEKKKRSRKRRPLVGCLACGEEFLDRSGVKVTVCDKCHRYYCERHLWHHRNPNDRRYLCRRETDAQTSLPFSYGTPPGKPRPTR